MDKSESSYQKGINNLLEKHREAFENIIAEYVLEVNNKYFSNQFPSTQICKILLKKLEKSQSKFSIFHKIVRKILKGWVNKDICKIVSKKSGHGVKTVVKFDENGFQRLKQKIIEFSIKKIEEGIETESKKEETQPESLKSRKQILDNIEMEIKDVFNALESEEE